MLIVERQQRVLEILKQRKTAELEDLARELAVSASTIRRDVDQMASQGLIERTRAGAIYREPSDATTSEAVILRMDANVAAKEAIGRAAAQLVHPNMTLLLDGGTTVLYAARQIDARPIQVVTNSLLIANHFADDDQVELLLIGGNLYPRSGVLVGAIATGCLADLHADLLLFSGAGAYQDELFNHNLPMVQVEQMMMQQATQSTLLLDATKFGRKSLVRVCSFDEVDQIISNNTLPQPWRDKLGPRLTIA